MHRTTNRSAPHNLFEKAAEFFDSWSGFVKTVGPRPGSDGRRAQLSRFPTGGRHPSPLNGAAFVSGPGDSGVGPALHHRDLAAEQGEQYTADDQDEADGQAKIAPLPDRAAARTNQEQAHQGNEHTDDHYHATALALLARGAIPPRLRRRIIRRGGQQSA